jgi:hypothetical protein
VIIELGPFGLELVPVKGGSDLVVTYTGGDFEWVGVASFPDRMYDEAVLWMNRIRSGDDIEDLLREWSPQETWDSFQVLRNRVGV